MSSETPSNVTCVVDKKTNRSAYPGKLENEN